MSSSVISRASSAHSNRSYHSNNGPPGKKPSVHLESNGILVSSDDSDDDDDVLSVASSRGTIHNEANGIYVSSDDEEDDLVPPIRSSSVSSNSNLHARRASHYNMQTKTKLADLKPIAISTEINQEDEESSSSEDSDGAQSYYSNNSSYSIHSRGSAPARIRYNNPNFADKRGAASSGANYSNYTTTAGRQSASSVASFRSNHSNSSTPNKSSTYFNNYGIHRASSSSVSSSTKYQSASANRLQRRSSTDSYNMKSKTYTEYLHNNYNTDAPKTMDYGQSHNKIKTQYNNGYTSSFSPTSNSSNNNYQAYGAAPAAKVGGVKQMDRLRKRHTSSPIVSRRNSSSNAFSTYTPRLKPNPGTPLSASTSFTPGSSIKFNPVSASMPFQSQSQSHLRSSTLPTATPLGKRVRRGRLWDPSGSNATRAEQLVYISSAAAAVVMLYLSYYLATVLVLALVALLSSWLTTKYRLLSWRSCCGLSTVEQFNLLYETVEEVCTMTAIARADGTLRTRLVCAGEVAQALRECPIEVDDYTRHLFWLEACSHFRLTIRPGCAYLGNVLPKYLTSFKLSKKTSELPSSMCPSCSNKTEIESKFSLKFE